MSSQDQLGNCSLLVSRSDFATYVQELQLVTEFNQTLLQDCANGICNALWGDGNADISGIGAIVGYFMESILGLIFAIILAHRIVNSKDKSVKKGILAKACEKFFDGAIYFSLSIQVACVIFEIRKDFGINANGLGGLTVQIVWAVALLCMLPLLYPITVLAYTDKDKSHYRLFLFCLCWLLFFYTFISQMIGDFASAQVGTGAGPGGTTIITTDEWNALNDLCLSGINVLSATETKMLSGFGAAGSIFITGYGLLALLWFIATQYFKRQTEDFRENIKNRFPLKRRLGYVVGCLAFIVPVLTVPQFWGLLRLRGLQKAIAIASGSDYADNQWTFGQVVAVMLFVPVFVEAGYEVVKYQKGGDVSSSKREK